LVPLSSYFELNNRQVNDGFLYTKVEISPCVF